MNDFDKVQGSDRNWKMSSDCPPPYLPANGKTDSMVLPVTTVALRKPEIARPPCLWSLQPCEDHEIIFHTLLIAHGRDHDSNILEKRAIDKNANVLGVFKLRKRQ